MRAKIGKKDVFVNIDDKYIEDNIKKIKIEFYNLKLKDDDLLLIKNINDKTILDIIDNELLFYNVFSKQDIDKILIEINKNLYYIKEIFSVENKQIVLPIKDNENEFLEYILNSFKKFNINYNLSHKPLQVNKNIEINIEDIFSEFNNYIKKIIYIFSNRQITILEETDENIILDSILDFDIIDIHDNIMYKKIFQCISSIKDDIEPKMLLSKITYLFTLENNFENTFKLSLLFFQLFLITSKKMKNFKIFLDNDFLSYKNIYNFINNEMYNKYCIIKKIKYKKLIFKFNNNNDGENLLDNYKNYMIDSLNIITDDIYYYDDNEFKIKNRDNIDMMVKRFSNLLNIKNNIKTILNYNINELNDIMFLKNVILKNININIIDIDNFLFYILIPLIYKTKKIKKFYNM